MWIVFLCDHVPSWWSIIICSVIDIKQLWGLKCQASCINCMAGCCGYWNLRMIFWMNSSCYIPEWLVKSTLVFVLRDLSHENMRLRLWSNNDCAFVNTGCRWHHDILYPCKCIRDMKLLSWGLATSNCLHFPYICLGLVKKFSWSAWHMNNLGHTWPLLCTS